MGNQTEQRRKYTRRRHDLALAFCAGVVVYVIGWKDASPVADAVIAWAFGSAAAILGVYQVARQLDKPKAPGKEESE